MQTPQNLHTALHILPVIRAGIARALIIFRDLISGLLIHINHALRQFQGLHRVIGLLLLMPVDEKLGSRPGNPADIPVPSHLKEKGFVGHSRLQALEIPDLALRNRKYFGYQLHGLIVRVLLVPGIKKPQLFQILKFIYLILRLAVCIHIDFIPLLRRPASRLICGRKHSFPLQAASGIAGKHILIYLLPVKLLGSRRLIVGLKNRQKIRCKFPRKIHRTVHHPLVSSAHRHVQYPALLVERKAPFLGIALLKRSAVPGAALVAVIHIFPHPIVRREKIHILSPKHIPGMVHGCQRIFIFIFRIVQKLDAELVDQVFELLFQISHGNGYVVDPRLVELTDLPLNHPLPKDLQKPFGRLKRERDKPGAKARRCDQSAVHLVRSQALSAAFQKLPFLFFSLAGFPNKPLFHTLL